LRVAAFTDITPDPSQKFTPVGMVEVDLGPDSIGQPTEPRLYLVSIDLKARSTTVKGQLVAVNTTDTMSAAATDAIDIAFRRIPQKLNPERTDSPYGEFQGLMPPPDSAATIYADGVCFVVKAVKGTGGSGDHDGDDDDDDDDDSDHDSDSAMNSSTLDSTSSAPAYNAYCSKPTGPKGKDAVLSVMDNFSSQYAQLQSLIHDAAARFGLEDRIQMDEIISTRESILGIQDCASLLTQEACSSDVIAAPVKEQYFARQYRAAFGGNGGNDGHDGDDDDDDREDQDSTSSSQNSPFLFASLSLTKSLFLADSPAALEAAVVKVLKPIELPTGGTVQPGDYVMHFWFDSNAVFYAATLTGVTTDNVVVTNQQIPALPASFIDKKKSGPNQPSSQISAWKVSILRGSWCTWWEGC
jgi:hypothetical protein